MASDECLLVAPRYFALAVQNFAEVVDFFTGHWKLAPASRALEMLQALRHVVFIGQDSASTFAVFAEMVGLPVSDRHEELFHFVSGSTTQRHILAFAAGPHHAINHIYRSRWTR